MRRHSFKRSTQGQAGFALVASIVVIAGILVLALSLLILGRVERRTARAYSHQYRVELALDAGTQAAMATLQTVVERDDFWVASQAVPNPDSSTPTEVTWLVVQDGTSGWRYLPLFGGTEPVSQGGARPQMPASPADLEPITGIPNNPLMSQPVANWETLDSDRYEVRYTYWLEDLHAGIDADIAGLVERDQGLDPRESGWFTLFDRAAIRDTGSLANSDIIANRELLQRTRDFASVLDDNQDGAATSDAQIAERYLNFGVPESLLERQIVPPYEDIEAPGEPQADLNQLVADADVEAIAAKINQHLPEFAERRGGMTSEQDYVKTLAASAIDYADEDQNPTLAADYRGVDSYPFVNEIYDRYEWIRPPAGQPGLVRIEVRTFVELWNPSDREISGSVELENVNKHRIIIPGLGEVEFGAVSFQPETVSLAANGFQVLEFSPADEPKVYEFDAGNFPAAPPLKFPNSWTTESNYRLSWNGGLVDYARGGLARTDGTLRPSEPKWKGQASVALDYRLNQSGDPRSSYLIQTWVFPNTYSSNSNWGGRALKRGINNTDFNEVRISESPDGHWFDGGHQSTAGVQAGSDNRLPTQLAFPSPEPNLAPAHISNEGRYFNVGELGNIFDPAQWEDVSIPSSSPNANSGGGITLAIGRPEYPVFDQPGRRARHLTDLFSVNPQAIRSAKGLINVNTAPREVLRTLWAGIFLDDDPALRRPVLTPSNGEQGDVFADAVIAARQLGPLLGLSDLLALRDNNGNFIFGDPNAWTSRPPDPNWDDQGREALFGRIANLVTFRSRAFRLVVSAEIVERVGSEERILARGRREMSFSIQPRRDDTGEIQPTQGNDFFLIDRRLR